MARLAAAFGIGVAWLVLAAVALYYVGGVVVQAAARGVVLLPQAGVWLFVALQEGTDWWTIAGRVGAALANAIVTPQVTTWLVVLELVGAAALFVLQRLFRNEGRSAGSEEVEK